MNKESQINVGIHANSDGTPWLQEKLEAREPLEIDSYFDSTRDRLEKK